VHRLLEGGLRPPGFFFTAGPPARLTGGPADRILLDDFSMTKIRPYSASVVYRNAAGQRQEEEFPVHAADPAAASDIAFLYVRQVMKLEDFELRVVGA